MNPVQLREHAWNLLSSDTLDLLVIGGGIVGAGVVRDAALRGLKVGLVDQQDFAQGTSSRSSRLLHGGLRYLEQGRVFLVREASVEKKIVQRIAPHLVKPLGFVFPAYRGQGRPLWQLKLGVKLYDLLCSGRNFQPSRGLSVKQTVELLPGLSTAQLVGAAYYFDALTNDARLVVDTLRSAAQQQAILINYAQFINASRVNSCWHCDLVDRHNGLTFQVQARSIVNATGPWADKLPHSSVKLRLSKGIHIVLDRARLPVEAAVVITAGKRILFVIPWADRVIVGTTDTDYAGAPEDVRVLAEDVDYVLQTLKTFFPDCDLSPAELQSVWAGLRPLIADPHGAPSDISRAHQIISPEPGWWDVAGGKLTTYRLMAEQTIDRIVAELGVKSRQCMTADQPLLAANQTRFSSVDPSPWSEEALQHFVNHEWALHLDDVLIRRAGWLHHRPLDFQQLEQASQWMAKAAQWDDQTRLSELQRTQQIALEQSQIQST